MHVRHGLVDHFDLRADIRRLDDLRDLGRNLLVGERLVDSFDAVRGLASLALQLLETFAVDVVDERLPSAFAQQFDSGPEGDEVASRDMSIP